jgi:BirA family transcriptional regulator, biotin operon repressor / biotin---[acetyl-CoA-carboxylase] ligase
LDSDRLLLATPYSLQVYEEVTSTQDIAADALDKGPVLIVAGRQTEGRGRSQRTWQSAPRAMAASLGIHPTWDIESWPLIPLVAGLAAAEVLGTEVGLKWPNDLVVGENKIGGILVEGSGAAVIIGCGLNLWWPHPPDGVGARWHADPGSRAVLDTATSWAEGLMSRLSRPPQKWGRAEYLDRSVTVGRRVTWEPNGVGNVLDVDERGALIVETDHGIDRLLAGEIRHLRAI